MKLEANTKVQEASNLYAMLRQAQIRTMYLSNCGYSFRLQQLADRALNRLDRRIHKLANGELS